MIEPATIGAPAGVDDADWSQPAHDECSFRPRSTRYCVCVFVINESERIHRQLARMQQYASLADIIVADGGSTDGSMCEARLSAAGVRALLVKRGPGRLSAQMRMALAWSLREGYEGVVVIDGNDKDDPKAIPSFLAALDDGVDHVQGSRYIAGGEGVNTPLSRSVGVRLLHAPLISLSAGCRYTDTTNGFRGYSRRFLLDPRVAPFREIFMAYELHYYLAIRACRLGYVVRELPVTRAYPAKGPAPTKISPVAGNIRVFATLLKACLRLYDPRRNSKKAR